jgi:hypothetical protein
LIALFQAVAYEFKAGYGERETMKYERERNEKKEEKSQRIKREAANYVAFTTISLSPPTIESRFRLWAAIGKKKLT